MRDQPWPDEAKISDWAINVHAHSRGNDGATGHYAHARAPGARFRGSVTVVPMRTGDALEFQAFLHSLRGRSGTFYMRLPGFSTERKTEYSDGTEHTDDTVHSDRLMVIAGTLATNAAKGADTIDLGALATSELTRAGTFAYLGARDTDGQLLRIRSVAGTIATIRPRLRRAFTAGEALLIGRPLGVFRLSGDTPAVPLLGNRSRELRVSITEAYE